MSENKCCGNCKYFKDEDVNGEGFCEVKYEFEGCYHECDNHEFRNNGWTEITPDNIDEIRKSKKKIVIMNPKEWDEILNEDFMLIPEYLFPEVTFENSPQEVELKLVKNDKRRNNTDIAR